MGESTKSMILFTDRVEDEARDALDAVRDSLSALSNAAVEVSKRNELLLGKLEDSNEKYAGLLAVQTAVLERNWAAAYNLAGQTGVEEQHLLRDLRWALERILEVAQADSYVAVRAHIIAGRFSIPLSISMSESLATVEDYEEAFESGDELVDFTIDAEEQEPAEHGIEEPFEGLREALEDVERRTGFRFELVEEASEPDLDELAEEVAEELREDEEFYQTFSAAIDAALKRLSPETRRDWELALGRKG